MEIIFSNKNLTRTAKVVPGTYRQEHLTLKFSDPHAPILLQSSLIQGSCSVYLNDAFSVEDVISFTTQTEIGSLSIGTPDALDHAVLDAEISSDPPCAHLKWQGRKKEEEEKDEQ